MSDDDLPKNPIRVLIAEDYGILRAGLRTSLRPYADIEVVGEASSGPEAVTEAARLRPQVILMDLRMPGGDGVTATREIVDGGGSAAVLVLTTFDSDEDVHAAIDAGASGYLLKDRAPEQLAEAIRTVASGENVLATKVTRAAFVELRRRRGGISPAPKPNPLTDRERQILEGLVAGKTNKQIAREIVMTPSGVKSAIERMFRKYGAKTRSQLAAWVTSEGHLR